MKIPEWIAPAVMLAGMATVVVGGQFAANDHHVKPGTITTVNVSPGAPDACHADCGVNDDWSYAGQVNTHPGCWQLTLRPTLAEFQCADGQRFTLVAR